MSNDTSSSIYQFVSQSTKGIKMEIIIKKKKIITVANGKVRNFYVGKGMEASIVSTNQVAFKMKKGKKELKGLMDFDDGRLVSVDCKCVVKGKEKIKITVSKINK